MFSDPSCTSRHYAALPSRTVQVPPTIITSSIREASSMQPSLSTPSSSSPPMSTAMKEEGETRQSNEGPSPVNVEEKSSQQTTTVPIEDVQKVTRPITPTKGLALLSPSNGGYTVPLVMLKKYLAVEDMTLKAQLIEKTAHLFASDEAVCTACGGVRLSDIVNFIDHVTHETHYNNIGGAVSSMSALYWNKIIKSIMQ